MNAFGFAVAVFLSFVSPDPQTSPAIPPSLAQQTLLSARDLGFEEGELGGEPTGWKVNAGGWKAELTEERGAQGRRCAKLFKAGEGTARFGNLFQVLPGAEFAGKHVTLRAKVLVVGAGRAQMWLRADRSHGGEGAFDNMSDRPIRAGDWQDATIDLDIEADASELNVGFMAFGGATAFVDEVRLEVSPARTTTQEASAPRALTERGLLNVVAASKLLGYVRYFHPSDAAVGTQAWDEFAVELMEQAEPASDDTDLAGRLKAVFASIAPTVDVWAGTPDLAPSTAAHSRVPTHFVQWLHHGAGAIAPPAEWNIYRSRVRELPRDPAPDPVVVVKSLGGGVSCRVPIVLPADAEGTIPRAESPGKWATKDGRPKLTASNRATRLAAVALAWNVFEHFYPYFEVVDVDWNAALPAALTKAAKDENELEFLATLRELVAKLEDGHGYVQNPTLGTPTFLPIAIHWAGTELVVVGKKDDEARLEIGDVILSIDDRSTEECYAEVTKRISAATEGWRRWQSLHALLVNLRTEDPARIVVRKPDGREEHVRLARVGDRVPDVLQSRRPPSGAAIEPGIVYFDLNGTSTEALDTTLPILAGAKAIVFDLRGYPGTAGKALMEHLVDEPATSPRWCVPVITRPDRESMEWSETGRWPLRPKEPRLKAKIAFLTDGRAVSYAESVMGIVEHYDLGEIVGSTTAGTNGNVNPFTLPGGYRVTWTGMRVLKHDGSRHHGIGIAPTVPVSPTARGIAEGRDEVLEKALEVLRAQLASEVAPPK